ncbi:MAG: deoxyuridine 5'-triphosphate nucleotidohydrolase [Candidatus Nanohaloarchaea archaeon]|nr:deoxyuridine 5'-triphosphate nucleotidohydrolase [Candidatus Nanohaloarchaea archaeon]
MQLNREQLQSMIEEHGLIQEYVNLERQLTPNGFDLSLGEVHRFQGPGQLDFSNEERELPDTEPVAKDGDWWELEQGVYKVVANEIVDIPLSLVGIGFPRSSLMRMGCHIQNAFWEAGYNGKTECLLCVDNPEGVRLQQDARILQISFHEMEEAGSGYDGRYSF